MSPEPAPAVKNHPPPARPRALLLADETMLTMGLCDLLKEQVELMILEAHQPAEKIMATILEWQPDVILLTSCPTSSFPCPWEWARLLKNKGWRLVRLLLQDNSAEVCHIQTVTITHLEELVQLITARPASSTSLSETGAPGRQ